MRKMRNKGSGGLRSRGKDTWEIKIDQGRDPLTGKKTIRYHRFHGSKGAANLEIARLVTAAVAGADIDPSKVTVAEFLERWERDWAVTNVTPKTLERWQDLIRTHIKPRLGAVRLQKLKAVNLAELYASLSREGRRKIAEGADPSGLAPRTVQLVHRILHRALGHAVQWSLLTANPAAAVEPPAAEGQEIEVLSQDQVRIVLDRLRGRSISLLVTLALGTGARRGELCGLRWRDVDLERAEMRIERSLEQTKAGLRFKSPKTRHGRRSIALPAYLVSELRGHWKTQQVQRLALGLGKDDAEALVFRRPDGSPLLPNSVTTEWRRLVATLKLPKVTFHALRHTHASQLIASGMDILTISRRLGHGSPAITLGVYGHLFGSKDKDAAAVFEAAYAGTFRE